MLCPIQSNDLTLVYQENYSDFTSLTPGLSSSLSSSLAPSLMETSPVPPPHVLLFPFPAQGHTLPHLDLAHHLALRGLHLTILTTPKNLPTLSPLLSSHPTTVQPLVLPFPPHANLPPGVENVRDIGNSGNLPIISALTLLRGPILGWFASHPNPPIAIVSDFFLGWTLHLADRLNIPRIAFFSSGAFLTCVSDFCWRHRNSIKGEAVVEFGELPGTPSFKEEHLPSIYRFYREGDPDWEIVRNGMEANMSSWGCVFNSFDALEGQYLAHLRRRVAGGRVFGLGPLSLIGLEEASSRRGPVSEGPGKVEDDVLRWLDGCSDDASVLYVCFGSQKVLSRAQMEALAHGLENSGVQFVWVVKSGSGGDRSVPDGFEAQVAGRGKVVKGWAPQVSILGHRAVGGFLSHCGWNSLQEAIVAGKLVLAWPMEADQFVNARLMVEDKKAAVRVCEGTDTVPDSDQLSRVIKESMRPDLPERARAAELRKEAITAVETGGSSSRDLDELVKELISITQPKNS